MDLESQNKKLNVALNKQAEYFAQILPINFKSDKLFKLDLASANPDFLEINMQEFDVQEEYVWGKIKSANAVAGIGGYGEKRGWYQRSENYTGPDEIRTVHLGVDIWVKANTPVCAPLSGSIHSFNYNAGLGDYGPTIILEHELEEIKFYSLYGHLSLESLEGKRKGDKIAKGEKFAAIGVPEVNGNWPAHLHFQLMLSMLEKEGDFPGVAAESQRQYWLTLCPDPNLILGCPIL